MSKETKPQKLTSMNIGDIELISDMFGTTVYLVTRVPNAWLYKDPETGKTSVVPSINRDY